MFAHISVYESRVETNKDFLEIILFITDLTVLMHLQACLVCEDPTDLDVACLNFAAAQSAVLKYTLFVNLPEPPQVTAKHPREETASHSIKSDIMSAPTGSNKPHKRDIQP
jgi:hypothetical protein